ncbi:MAG: hypothetical protein U1F50_15910 [Rubrivivax sp.]
MHANPNRPARRARAALLALLLAGAAAAAQEPAPSFEQAMLAYERSHWAEAYAGFAQLADRGHPEAARLALQMWTWGPRLYGTRFAASTPQVERWRQTRRALAVAKEAP